MSVSPQPQNPLCHSLRVTAKFIDRTQKLKDARSEAQKDIDAYRAQKEEEFKAFEGKVDYVMSQSLLIPWFLILSQHAGATKTKQSAIDKETDEKLEILKQSYQEAIASSHANAPFLPNTYIVRCVLM
jgi:hypothetical protein